MPDKPELAEFPQGKKEHTASQARRMVFGDYQFEIYLQGLNGVDGIVHVLRSLLAEADLIMAIDGYPFIKDLTPDTLRRVG